MHALVHRHEGDGAVRTDEPALLPVADDLADELAAVLGLDVNSVGHDGTLPKSGRNVRDAPPNLGQRPAPHSILPQNGKRCKWYFAIFCRRILGGFVISHKPSDFFRRFADSIPQNLVKFVRTCQE